jgi:hypothetical protein
VTKEEFERIVAPAISETVNELAHTLSAAGVESPALAGLYLGGHGEAEEGSAAAEAAEEAEADLGLAVSARTLSKWQG